MVTPIHDNSIQSLESTIHYFADIFVYVKYYSLQRLGLCTQLAAHECMHPFLVYLVTHLQEGDEDARRNGIWKMNTKHLLLTFMGRFTKREGAWASLAAAGQRRLRCRRSVMYWWGRRRFRWDHPPVQHCEARRFKIWD
jgi:hypothetical protein